MKTLFHIECCIVCLVSIGFLGCENESPLVPETDLVVVQGYLYAGEDVKEIRIVPVEIELGE